MTRVYYTLMICVFCNGGSLAPASRGADCHLCYLVAKQRTPSYGRDVTFGIHLVQSERDSMGMPSTL